MTMKDAHGRTVTITETDGERRFTVDSLTVTTRLEAPVSDGMTIVNGNPPD